MINFNILNEHTLSKFPKTENKVDPNRYLELDYKSFLNMPLDPSTRTYYQWLFQTKTDNLKTSSGLILKNNNGTLSFSLPVNALHPINKLWDLVVGNPMFYHNSANNLLLNDFLLVMNQLKAQGFKSCTISINVDDPKLRDRMMQDAYAAARLAGFPDNKITFNIPDPPENKNPIENKTAAELGGQLNNGRQRAESRLAAWEKQKQDLEKDQKPVIDNQVTEIARAIAEKLNPDETIEANTALNISRSPRLS